MPDGRSSCSFTSKCDLLANAPAFRRSANGGLTSQAGGWQDTSEMETPAQEAVELVELIRQLIRLQPRLKALLPTDLARLKARLRRGGHTPDYELFYRVASVLSRSGEPPTMGEMREALGVPLSSATRMVEWLVRHGYARRFPDPEDRRFIRVALTDEGRRLTTRIDAFLQRQLRRVIRRFSPTERTQLVTLLRKLVAALDEVSR